MNTMKHKHDPGYSDISKKKDIPCGVVQDLLILYEDNVCSDDSSSLIQEHIKDCDNCRNAYEQAAKPFPAITAGKEEEMEEGTRFIKALRKCRKKITLLNAIIAGFFLLVAAALIRIGWMEFKDSSLFAVSAGDASEGVAAFDDALPPAPDTDPTELRFRALVQQYYAHIERKSYVIDD